MKDRYLRNSIVNIKNERLLSITNIFVMSLAFLVLGIFVTVIVITQSVLRTLEKQAQVTIFFKDDFSEERILALKQTLEVDSRIHFINYLSKEQAFEVFKEFSKDDPELLNSVTSSILPASLEVQSKNIDDLPKLAGEFSSLDGVEEVRFFEDVINRFKKFSNIAYAVGLILAIVFLIISYTLVLSTLRMTINSKGVELEIMKLVGATNAYVKKPLIYQGIFYGFTSSLISGFFLGLIILIANHFNILPSTLSLGFLPNLDFSPLFFSITLWLMLIFSGTLLGFLGSVLAMKRYLKY